MLRRSFAPAAIEGLRPVVAEEVAVALGVIVTGEPVDVVAAFTRPVPFRVVARLLGLPRSAWAELEALEPPFAAFWRRATHDAMLDGVAIRAGGLVELPYALLNAGAARHLSFGHGIHFCLGAALARLEAQVALRAVLDAASAIEVAGPVERLASPSVSGHRRVVLRLAA